MASQLTPAQKAWRTRRRRKAQVVGFYSKGKGKKRKAVPITKPVGPPPTRISLSPQQIPRPPPHVRKDLPRRVIKPMLPEDGSVEDVNLHSHAEQRKYDGTRCLLIKEGDEILLVGRSWLNDYLPKFPEIAEEILKLPVHSVILDGELTFFRKGTDRDVFLTALANPETKKGYVAKVMLFDVLYVNGESVEDKKFETRVEMLRQIVPDSLKHLDEVKTVKGKKAKVEYFQDLSRRQGEGVVLKDLRSPYREGQQTREWLKVKNWKSDEAVVVGYTQGNGVRAKTFGSVILAQKDHQGRWRYVGKASGFSDQQLTDLLQKMKTLSTGKCPLKTGRIPDAKAWIKPELVVEVKYYERTPNKVFRFPSFMRERHDKAPDECKVR